MQQIWFEKNVNRRHCGSVTKNGEKYPANPAKSPFQRSLKITLFSWLIIEHYVFGKSWMKCVPNVKHLEEESTAFQILEKIKNQKKISSP